MDVHLQYTPERHGKKIPAGIALAGDSLISQRVSKKLYKNAQCNRFSERNSFFAAFLPTGRKAYEV